jgi:carboxypeptidase PM20D1
MPFLQKVVMGNRWLFDGVITWQFARSPSTNAVVRSTLTVTQIGTETSSNQIATIAEATVSTRLLPGDTAEAARDHVLALSEDLRLCSGEPAIECQVEEQAKGELVSSVDCEEFLTLQRTIHEIFPNVIVAAGLTSVSTDSSWYYGVTDKVYRFIPMRLTPEDVVRIHGINERISVGNMVEIATFYGRLIQNAACGLDGSQPSARGGTRN